MPSVADRVLGELAIATRSDPEQPDERAPHHVDAAESRRRGHLLEASVRAFELTARRTGQNSITKVTRRQEGNVNSCKITQLRNW